MMVTGLPAVLLAVALLLVVVSAVQPLARRLQLPETVLLALVGILLGGSADVLLRTPLTDVFDGAARTLLDFPVDSEAYLMIFLPILVFQGALAIDVRRLAHEDRHRAAVSRWWRWWRPRRPIGFALYPFSHMPLVVCLMLGAIVANTDPSAVAGIFREIGAATRPDPSRRGGGAAERRRRHLDLRHPAAGGDRPPSGLGRRRRAGLRGVVLRRAGRRRRAGTADAHHDRLDRWHPRRRRVTLTIALPYVAYIVCDRLFGFSGVVATAAAGLTFSVYGPSTLRPQTWRFLEELWEQLVFWAGIAGVHSGLDAGAAPAWSA